ncbi:MAG: helicase-exonuclease AddAB subunit AddA [Sporolactobacillus sp.]
MTDQAAKWTEAQLRAMTAAGHDVLVAAAAGSGKTAVLVERIIRKITAPDRQTSIDRLLVVTFTKAAAAEMRERIGKALEQQLAAAPGDLYLRRQQALLAKAPIMTLHAFCHSVIHDYYYLLDIDPGFRLIDEIEAALIKEEVFDGVIEKKYADASDDFFQMVDCYSGDRSDQDIQSLVYRLYDFSMSHPHPRAWLNSIVESYRAGQAFDAQPWAGELKACIKSALADTRSALGEALTICRQPGGPSEYAEILTEEQVQLERLPKPEETAWDDLRAAVRAFTFKKLPPCRDKSVDKAFQKAVKRLRDAAKKNMEELQNSWFCQDAASCIGELEAMRVPVTALCRLVADFTAAYHEEKQEKGLLDFSDLEHECLRILRDPAADAWQEKPSEAALHYQARFAEVLIDEYQDTNRVQEAIIRLITRDEGSGGNLFMVGDIKQSIYGFRLAEPTLFLEKYRRFAAAESSGEKIDLSSNFRSRHEVIDATNFIFRQVMDRNVGGVAYDRSAELICGASYPALDAPADLEIIDRSESAETDAEADVDRDALAVEAGAIADRIAAMIGGENGAYQVFDRIKGGMRAIAFRDIAVLTRAAGSTAAVLLEALSARNIPAYTQLSKGYFDTIEISVMLAALQLIDNPYQDIPLASVLRSPMFRFSSDELAVVRTAEREHDFLSALLHYCSVHTDDLSERLSAFLDQLESWREAARSRSVAQLIWQIYRDSGYFDYVGGLMGGTQRQANLKALYDRARQYERTSFRGLFRFLRFIERLRESGGDMGEARALSEQADVVRIMTIHKSKGLEFPVVFIAGMGRKFNMRDTSAPVLLHPQFGLGTRHIDPKVRTSTPTLPYLVMKARIRSDALAEEMRILYVAMTRAKEKLILVASSDRLEQAAAQWSSAVNCSGWLLPAYQRRAAGSFLDWIGPCLIRHRAAAVLRGGVDGRAADQEIAGDASQWRILIVPAGAVHADPAVDHEADRLKIERVKNLQPVPVSSGFADEVARQLNWTYPNSDAARHMAKQTVTELKSQHMYFSDAEADPLGEQPFLTVGSERPRFLQEGKLSSAEKGTAVHLLMQHLDLRAVDSAHAIAEQARALAAQEVLTEVQARQINADAVAHFFQSDVGQDMRGSVQLVRECPFSYAADSSLIYPSWSGAKESVLIQGVIDCLFKTSSGLTLIDYKTDHLSARLSALSEIEAELRRRYRLQLLIYRRAVEAIWQQQVARVGLYAFDSDLFVDFSDERWDGQ